MIMIITMEIKFKKMKPMPPQKLNDFRRGEREREKKRNDTPTVWFPVNTS
jgi:hypothetical protein